MSWPGWQLVNLSHRRDKIWRWQFFLFLSVFDTSLSHSVIPSLVCNQMTPPPPQINVSPLRYVLISSDSNHCFSLLCPCDAQEQQAHISMIRQIRAITVIHWPIWHIRHDTVDWKSRQKLSWFPSITVVLTAQSLQKMASMITARVYHYLQIDCIFCSN